MKDFTRSQGTTASERVLAKLSDGSFLTLWSYPNVFKKKSKELCDLLVVFANTTIIFSDKSCKFKDTQRPKVDWERWYRKTIRDSQAQAALTACGFEGRF